uniref:Uncharacterized protein n=1 Tax=Romanomermis culicivorax TaxID=13658 RepID=A0A915KSQ3_ROMCU
MELSYGVHVSLMMALSLEVDKEIFKDSKYVGCSYAIYNRDMNPGRCLMIVLKKYPVAIKEGGRHGACFGMTKAHPLRQIPQQ